MNKEQNGKTSRQSRTTSKEQCEYVVTEESIRMLTAAMKDNRRDKQNAVRHGNFVEETYCIGFEAAMSFALGKIGIGYHEQERRIKDQRG